MDDDGRGLDEGGDKHGFVGGVCSEPPFVSKEAEDESVEC